jgi:hypothetical protein
MVRSLLGSGYLLGAKDRVLSLFSIMTRVIQLRVLSGQKHLFVLIWPVPAYSLICRCLNAFKKIPRFNHLKTASRLVININPSANR